MDTWNHNRSIASVRISLDQARDLGIADRKVLAGTGLTSDQVQNDLLEVTACQELQVVGNLLAEAGDPVLLGVMLGRRYRLSIYGIWGYGLICSDTFGAAVTRALRYIRLTYAFTGVTARHSGAAVTMRFLGPDIDKRLRDTLVVRDMTAAFMINRELVGADFAITNLALALDDAPSIAAREAVLSHFGAQPFLDGPFSEYSYADAWSSKRLPLANSVSAAYCDRHCLELERKDASLSTAGKVGQIIQTHGFERASLDEVSRTIGLSPRTLKRRLQDEQTSLSSILADARHNRAKMLLEDDDISIAVIARELGYSDASSFSQAFKRMEAISPLHYRKQRI